MSEYFPKPKSSGANIKVESDLSNCDRKTDLINATAVDTSYNNKKAGLVNLEYDIDKLDIDNLYW